MRGLMRHYGVSVVLHAAAYKHVPLVEMNPVPGVQNNLFGTLATARAARDAGVERFVLISTDKAIAPTGMLGASKYLAELAVMDLAGDTRATRFSIVRFGNVYGSSGSVVPLFRQQIDRGGPLTVTDPDATRFFLRVEEAAELVLTSARLTQGRELFAFDMGHPISIRGLANRLMLSAGRPNLPVTVTGLRPGERLHECSPVTPDMLATAHPRIFRRQVPEREVGDIGLLLRGLQTAIAAYDEAAVRRLIDRWVRNRAEQGTVRPEEAPRDRPTSC